MQARSRASQRTFAFADRVDGDWAVHPAHAPIFQHRIQTDLTALVKSDVVVGASLAHISGDGEAQYGVFVSDVNVEDGPAGKIIVVDFKAFTDGNDVHILKIMFSGVAFGR